MSDTNIDQSQTPIRSIHDGGVFGDVADNIRRAIDEEVARRRREGLPVVVDRGAGIEVLPPDVT